MGRRAKKPASSEELEPAHDDDRSARRETGAFRSALTLPLGESAVDPSDLRREVRVQVGDWRALREKWRDRIRVLTNAPKRPSGKACILAYLQIFLNQNVDSYELLVVSGIAEYARRIRELRVQEGYEILARDDEAGVPSRHYRLASPEPNLARSHAWKTASKIRRKEGPDKLRILELLRASVGVPLTHEQLQYVGKGKSTRERLRDLRINDGWRIATRRTGRPDLRNDQYMLISDEQLPVHDRTIPVEIYEAVIDRDDRRCRKCNWRPEAHVYGGKRHSLEVHHLVHFSQGGSHDIENLVTLCDLDHDIVHRDHVEGKDVIAAWLALRPAYWVDGA